MAIGKPELESVLAEFKEELLVDVRKELDERQAQLANAPAPATGAFFNPEEFREEFLELLREELHLFKQELLTDLAQASPAPTSTKESPLNNGTEPKRKSLKDWW